MCVCVVIIILRTNMMQWGAMRAFAAPDYIIDSVYKCQSYERVKIK